MSAADRDGERSLHAALESLRIERGDAPPSRSGRARRCWLAAAGVAAVVATGVALGPAPTPDESAPVAAATVVAAPPSAPAGVALSGAGYVVTGDRYISLAARVPGRVARYRVEEGERVVAGQALVELDGRHYAAAVREAEASRDVARANARLHRRELERLRALHEHGVASSAALDVARNRLAVSVAEVERLAARLAQLRLDLEETVVRAPTAGVVLERLKEVGEMAVPGGFSGSGELVRLANTSELRAEVDVSEGDLAKVSLDQRSEVVPDAFPSRRYAARVVELAPQIDRQKGTLRVEVAFLAPDESLRPDMSVRVDFLADEEVGSGDAASVGNPR